MDYLNYIDYRENDGGTLKIKIKPLLRFSRKLIFINITILTCTDLHPKHSFTNLDKPLVCYRFVSNVRGVC